MGRCLQPPTRTAASRVVSWVIALSGAVSNGCSGADGFGAEILDGDDSASSTTSGPDNASDTTSQSAVDSASAASSAAGNSDTADDPSRSADDTASDSTDDLDSMGDPADDSDGGDMVGMDAAEGMGNQPTGFGFSDGGTTAMNDPESMEGSGGSGSDDEASTNSSSGGMSSMMTSDEPNDFGEVGIMRGMTAAHNAVRAEVSPDDPLPDLVWSQDLADYAQDWADTLAEDCDPRHRNPNDFGENIATFGALPVWPESMVDDAVDGWAAEIACWDFGTFAQSDSCDMQCAADLNANGCGHYTQIVWRETLEVGCGIASCSDEFNWEIWVCNYDPPGNWVGETPY